MKFQHVLVGVVVCAALGVVLATEATDKPKELPYRPGRPFQRERDLARANQKYQKSENATLEGFPGDFGVDFAIWTNPTDAQWKCMHDEGNYKFVVIEGWNGGRGVNTNLGELTSKAWSHNFNTVDLYAFMCPNCGNSAASVRSMLDTARAQGAKFDKVWLDVEQCSGCWGGAADNIAFLKSLVAEYKAHGVNPGIYTSTGEWPAVTGGTADFSDLPIWYAHYDGNPSFSDWTDFGGWRSPSIKQFADSAGNTCGTSVDRDWHPSR